MISGFMMAPDGSVQPIPALEVATELAAATYQPVDHEGVIRLQPLAEMPLDRLVHIATPLDGELASWVGAPHPPAHSQGRESRCVLLHGPSGTGKTWLLHHARHVVLAASVVVLASSEPSVVQRAITTIRSIEPERLIAWILDDIDYVGASELCAVLDWIVTIPGVLVLMTAQSAEGLDPRLIGNPGRVSMLLELGAPDASARRRVFEARLDTSVGAGLDPFVQATGGYSIGAIAAVADRCGALGFDAASAVRELRASGVRELGARPNPIGFDLTKGVYE